MKINDCIAVVTGGASGLGEATVRMFVKGGGQAAILDLEEERGRKIASELGDMVIFCMTDVTEEMSVQAAVDKAID
jgi:3-hydroxyacyl-CoA dehydrogenase/3-hydroxy-2-methylbutyryl-CoA dehydrogenase